MRGRFRGTAGNITLVLVLLAPLAAPIWIGYAAWSEQREEMRAWDVAGPPCPASRWPLRGTSSRPPQSFDYAGAHFERRSGAVSCADLKPDGWWSRKQEHVCQFSAPVVLSFSYRGATAVIAPGVGRPATIKIADGRASCVVAGTFRG
jgi:hypothetical protein